MKISYNWLKRYLDFDIKPMTLSQMLTDCGLEIEGVEQFESVKGGLEGIVIGEVKTVIKHPNADRLTLTTVYVGEEGLLKIVCGAPNVEAGQKVAVAVVGATLYSEKGSFKIKKSEIRGETSDGMICAEDELGLGTSHEGIMVLEPEAKAGTKANEYFNVVTDTVFEIGLTPNRGDAASHIGTARDIAAVLNNFNEGKNNLTNTKKVIDIPSVADFVVDNQDRKIDVIIEDVEACPRYTGLTITGVQVTESPMWLQNYLKAIDIRPINNIVDISNFVLFETGQPMHFFDADAIIGDKVIIKKLKAGTKFTTLDEVERELTANDLMICNDKEGMCIAGVFGGSKSGVTGFTKNLFLESAYFDPKSIRKTSKHHALKSDASFRFERGADPNITIYAIKRAANLIMEIAGGKVSSDIIDVYPKPIDKWEIDITYEYIDRLIGKKIERETIKNILQDLEIEILNENDDGLKLLIPTFKVDVKTEADIVEEILRIYGYNNIEVSSSVRSSISYTEKPNRENIQNLVSDFLSANGFSEIISNSLTKSSYHENLNTYKTENCVRIYNPLSKDLEVLRQTLLFGGLEAINRNLNRKTNNLKLYEFGSVYSHNNAKEGKDLLSKFSECRHLALFLSGRVENESWYGKGKEVDFYFCKAVANNILNKIGLKLQEVKIAKISNDIISKGLLYSLRNTKVMEIGIVSTKILKQADIKQNVFYVDFIWDNVLKLLNKESIEFKELPKYHEVRRDLSLLINNHVEYADIEKIAFQTERKILKKVSLFDIYEEDKLEKGKKSYAVSFILQKEEKTLTDEEINNIMNKIIMALEKQLDAKIR